MSDALKNILSEEEQQQLAKKGIEILEDDELELVSGGSSDFPSTRVSASAIHYWSTL